MLGTGNRQGAVQRESAHRGNMKDEKARDERRRFQRLPISGEVLMSVLMPHNTFSTFSIRGIATDISIGGMRIKTYQLQRQQYLDMIRGMSHAKLELRLPFLDEPLYFRGILAWSEYHDPTNREPAHCYLGLAFHEFTEEAQREFGEVLRLIADRVYGKADLNSILGEGKKLHD